MRIPLEISYRGVEKNDSIEELIREKAGKLERICDYISSCRVAVEQPQKYQSSGNPYRVRLDITVPPGHELAVIRPSGKGDMHADLPAVIRAAFEAAERQLRELKGKQRRDVKTHPDQQTQAIVVDLYKQQDYGFIRTLDGRQVYFHRNAVLHDDFDRLEIGTGVHFNEVDGEKGPQASSVQIIDKPGARPPKTTEEKSRQA
ncbi:MAG: HPF/RaiA family ribosome-associated protein [Chitinispirillaceae bacterium]